MTEKLTGQPEPEGGYSPDQHLNALRSRHRNYSHFLKAALEYTMNKYGFTEEEAKNRLSNFWWYNYAHL